METPRHQPLTDPALIPFPSGPDWIPHRVDRSAWTKSEGGRKFRIDSPYEPSGDQVTSIPALVKGLEQGERDQVLLGATGTGKTFTMAKVIEATQRPAIIFAHNKTLAAQLYGEFKAFFQTMRLNILYPIMIIISRRPMFRARILLSKKTVRSMNRSIECAMLQPVQC